MSIQPAEPFAPTTPEQAAEEWAHLCHGLIPYPPPIESPIWDESQRERYRRRLDEVALAVYLPALPEVAG